MLRDPSTKYRPFPPINLPDRQWPSRTITQAPIWLSTDMRDGNQALIDPMDAEKKTRFFDLIVKTGIKEIEVGFPASGATDFDYIQDLVRSGRVPDDVTLLWAEDNWGDVRRLPTAEERKRSGGAGIYYHFDYHGGPRSYQWINTSPIPKIWDQMSLAKQYGADRIWIVNVGHFKGYEFPLEYFMHLAWDTSKWTNDNL